MCDSKIDVEGVIPEMRKNAIQEIDQYLELSKEFMEKDIISKIIIASDFNKTVMEYLPAFYKEIGFEYDAKRHAVRACAKTIDNIKNGVISFVLVFDGQIFGKWEQEASAFRFETIFHEMFHAILGSNRFNKVGMQNYPFKSYDGARGNCLAIGVMARDEYLIDMAVGKIFSKFAKDDNGQPVDLRQFHIISGTDVQKEFTTLLDEMPNFIRRNVSDYKYGILKIEELWDKIRTYVTELITVFAHAVASYKGQIELLEKCANLTKYEAYELYLAEHLDAISLNWRNFYDEHRLDGEQDDDELWLEIYKIFMNCGLILANSPTRELYIHVPCFK